MEHRDGIIQTEDGENFLPVSVIYGSNGGGKSNVLEALHTQSLDAKIYLVLLQNVVLLYNNIRINKNGTQLIFTSHDLSIMNYDVFRCDEIWLVAKGK